MGNRKEKFEIGEYYHVYNRGIEGRSIFSTPEDVEYFISRAQVFNKIEAIGGLYRESLPKYKKNTKKKLVDIVCYAFNPNHFHFLMTPLVDKGIENFMQRLCTGHAMFFNNKYKRKGRLFQGVFKSTHIDSNEYLLHLSVYINLNDRAHQLRGGTSQLVRTSWGSYIDNSIKNPLLGDKRIITDQFKNTKEYEKFAEDILPYIIGRKKLLKELEQIMIDED